MTIKKNDIINLSNFVEKFTNFLMIHGKKMKAYTIFYESLNLLKKTKPKNFLELGNKEFSSQQKTSINFTTLHIVFQAVENVKPNLEVRKVRIAGMTYQVPSLLSKKRQQTLAIRWIIDSAKKRKIHSKLSFSECLSQEILDAYKKQGQARQKRDELHKIAEANRAYIRYRWW